MTHQGDHVHNTKRGEFIFPLICHTGSDAVLVADLHNYRLQLRHAGEWSRVLLEPEPMWPQDAVYVGGALFVLSNYPVGNPKIIKYVPK